MVRRTIDARECSSSSPRCEGLRAVTVAAAVAVHGVEDARVHEVEDARVLEVAAAGDAVALRANEPNRSRSRE